MMDYSHHKARRDGPVVVLVPVPVGGSPKEANQQRPPRYPHQDRSPWRPARDIPTRQISQAEVFKRWFEQMHERDEAARSL